MYGAGSTDLMNPLGNFSEQMDLTSQLAHDAFFAAEGAAMSADITTQGALTLQNRIQLLGQRTRAIETSSPPRPHSAPLPAQAENTHEAQKVKPLQRPQPSIKRIDANHPSLQCIHDARSIQSSSTGGQ